MQRFTIIFALFSLLAIAGCGNKQAAPPPDEPAPPVTDPTPVEPAPTDPAPDQTACAPTGCSGTVCAPAGEDIMTTCEYKPEYDCYKQATCERQPSGDCGWTPSDELDTCIASARGE